MPRPPLLPTIGWKALFERALEYPDWLARGEHPDNREKMEQARQSLRLSRKEMEHLSKIPKPVHVLAFAEDWCGDVVRHVPVLQLLAESCANLRVRYLSRQDSLETFVRYLTNGGEAIPKFIFLSDQFAECGNWGPMPLACRELIARGKACEDVAAARQKVAQLYERDPQRREVIRELLHLIEIASSTAP